MSRSRHCTNWPSSLPDTSCMTPRPNWATLPVTVRSVAIFTSVCPPPWSDRSAVTVALALPWPRVSRPDAFSTMRRAASSAVSMVAAPLYCAVIGPTFTFTMPRYSSPSISCSSAPGMQGAIRSTSSRNFQASSMGSATRKVSSISMRGGYDAGPPAAPSGPASSSGAGAVARSRRARSSGVSTSVGSPVPCSRPPAWAPGGAAPGRPRRRRASRLPARQPGPGGRGCRGCRGRWPPRAARRAARPATRVQAAEPMSGWSASPMQTAATSARPSRWASAARIDHAIPRSHSGLRTTSTASPNACRATAATSSASRPTTRTTGASPDARAASRAQATSGRPRRTRQRLGPLATEARPAPAGEDRRRDALGRGHGRATGGGWAPGRR